MKKVNKLQLDQLDRKMGQFVNLPEPPAKGWIYAIRKTLGMSYRQIAKRLKITPQSVQGFEKRELNKSITLKNLHEIAQSLNMRLVYGFVPRTGSIEKIIEDQAFAIARRIVMRTDTTMKLEDQGIPRERLEKAILELTHEIKQKMPRYLWD
ncbi:MAG: mobile mystery protein A [Bacteroidota bacterium]